MASSLFNCHLWVSVWEEKEGLRLNLSEGKEMEVLENMERCWLRALDLT